MPRRSIRSRTSVSDEGMSTPRPTARCSDCRRATCSWRPAALSQGICRLRRRSADQTRTRRRNGNRRLHLPRTELDLLIAGARRLQCQGSIRGVADSRAQGCAVRAFAERRSRRPLFEVLQLRQHQQLEGRDRIPSDRRPAVARHRIESVPRADADGPVRGPGGDAPTATDPCAGAAGVASNRRARASTFRHGHQPAQRLRDGYAVRQPERLTTRTCNPNTASRSTTALSTIRIGCRVCR